MEFKIFQLKNTRETEYGFMWWEFAKEHGFKMDDYEEVYSSEREYRRNFLDILFEEFNINRPEDFRGHSLSVSDVVAVKRMDKKWHYYYCDSFGWEDITDRIKPKKKKFRVWAEAISYVYVDIEAENEEKAMEAAEELDGGDFHDDGIGDWEYGSVARLDDDADVDYTYDEIVNPE